MSNKLLNEIKLEISRREKELKTLVDVANTLASLNNQRGRKSKFKLNLPALDGTVLTKGKSRRGRPAGSKNKPGAKKTGPKPQPAVVPAVKSKKKN
ncbi:MAG: hypothetical protein RL092_1023 [Bacteroidota bacterium]|jgi:hypothetical protein